MIRHNNENGSVVVSTSVYTDIAGTAAYKYTYIKLPKLIYNTTLQNASKPSNNISNMGTR